MSLPFVKFLFPNREEEDNSEWILTVSEVKRWRAVVSKESRDGQSLQQLKRYLTEKKFTISVNTFANGFIQVLHQACKSRVFTLVEYLLENHLKHFDVNQLVLHHPEPARYFRSGCSISISDKAAHVKDTLVHAAASGDSIRILKLLISHGASVNIPDCCSRVPIMTSIEQRNKNAVRFLIDNGADLQYQDSDGLTPLMYAARVPAISVFMSHFVKSKDDLDVTDNRGYTALHVAVSEGTITAVQTLLQLGSSPIFRAEDYVPFSNTMIDHKNFLHHDFEHENHLNSLSLAFQQVGSLLPQQRVDILLISATFYFTCFCKQYCRPKPYWLKASYHKMAEALTLKMKLALPPTDSVSSLAYDGVQECQTYKEFKSNVSNIPDDITQCSNFAIQCLLIRERCLGYGNQTLLVALFIYSEWMFYQRMYYKGLRLVLHASQMLTYICTTPSHPSFKKFPSLVLLSLDFLRKIFNESISVYATKLKKAEVRFFRLELREMFLNSIISCLVDCVCFCIATAKGNHSHVVTGKSFLSGLQILLAIFNVTIENEIGGIHVTKLIEQLVKKCPKVVLDINGCPTTLLHVVLSHISKPGALIALIIENGGQAMLNETGPLGNRPLQNTVQDVVIKQLIEYGAHLDAVNSCGHTVYDTINIFAPHLLPECTVDRLSCISARAVAVGNICYQSMDLPPRIKSFISLHDRNTQDYILRNEIHFIGDDIKK